MQRTALSWTGGLGVAGAMLVACGDAGSGRTDDGGGSGSISITSIDPSGTDPTTGDSDSASGPSSATMSTATDSSPTDPDDSGSGDGPIFDLGAVPDVGNASCGGKGKGGAPEFSFIWVANSSQGTISKINTQTMVEEGRYIVRADSAGSPSRTSVSLSGDVAVANRNGGVTKVYANVEQCAESNGMPGIQTSTGAADILPWATEECVAWHTPFAYSTQRPVAWAPAPFDEATCTYQNQKLWTSGANDVVTVHRLDGETGVIEETIPIPEMAVNYFGAYGGAVNGDGDFWITNYAQPPTLARIDAASLDVEIVAGANVHSYGFTVDSAGRPWVGGFINGSARYSPATGTWDLLPNVLGYGIQEDADGLMWLATFSPEGVRAIDSDSLALGAQINLPGSGCKGVSIDFYGYVWVVDMSQNAFRIDPDTQQVDTYAGLTGPYTYSDMTGWGLSNVAFPPG